MKTYLIQRGKFEDRDFKKGIDSIVNLDYMGSSEFEWGALPESLSKIRERINEYTYLDVPINGKVITVFCKDSQKSEVKRYLIDLAEQKWNLQEYSDFDNYIYDSKFLKSSTDFWWDIVNDLMFWKKNISFEEKFKQAINHKPQ